VFPEFSTKRVMTAEWIDGVRLSDMDGINKLGVSKKKVMQTMVDLFSAQMFKFGYVHCDPHPGNLFVRVKPNGQPELVLIDHGLYVRETEKFRLQYCLLWKSLLTFDDKTIQKIGVEWGIGDEEYDLFASATLLRPYEGHRDEKLHEAISKEDQYQVQLIMKRKLKNFLKETDRLPLELIFIGRNMRIVQGNNQRMGSPVNRVKITATWASKCLGTDPQMTRVERLNAWLSHLKFLGTCFLLDITFYTARIKQILFTPGIGFEDLLEKSMARSMGSELGVTVNHRPWD